MRSSAVYAAGLLQGLALVTFPAASAVLTSPTGYGLSTGAYGAMFVPQTIMAVAAALLGARLGARWGQKRVLLVGLAANLSSMALLVASRFVMESHAAAFALLLGATACMGIGFGLTVPAINVLAASLFPRRVDVAVLALNALLGLGTALAPVLVAVFVGARRLVGAAARRRRACCWRSSIWSLSLPLAAGGAGAEARVARSRRFWLFAAFALCYGVVETLNGNWAILYMKGVLHAGASLAALTLTLFWAAATAGRLAVRRGRALAPRPPHLWAAPLGHRARLRRHGAGPVVAAGARERRPSAWRASAARRCSRSPSASAAAPRRRAISSPAISSATASPPSASPRCTIARA